MTARDRSFVRETLLVFVGTLLGGFMALAGVLFQHSLGILHSDDVLTRVLLAEISDIRGSLESDLLSHSNTLGSAHPSYWPPPDPPISEPIFVSLDPKQLGSLEDPELASDWVSFYRQMVVLAADAKAVRDDFDQHLRKGDELVAQESITPFDKALFDFSRVRLALSVVSYVGRLSDAVRQSIALEDSTWEHLGIDPPDRSLFSEHDGSVSKQIGLFDSVGDRVSKAYELGPSPEALFKELESIRELIAASPPLKPRPRATTNTE